MTSATDGIASSSGDSTFCQTSLEDEKSFVKVLADDLSQASDDFAVGTMFGVLV